MRGIHKLGVAAVALAVSVLGANPSHALVDDPYTSFTQPANALVMPFNAQENWQSFFIVSNIAGTSPSSGGEILGVTTHWTYWSEDCDHLVDVWVCLTLNDTIVVDPTDISSVDVGNVPIGPVTDLSVGCEDGAGCRGMVIVTAYETDEICSDGSLRGFIPVDNAIVGSSTTANTAVGYSYGLDAIGLGLEPFGRWTELPKNTDDAIDVLTFNPATLDGSAVTFLSLEERAGSGDTEDVELGPNTVNRRGNLILYDNLEVGVSLPDVVVKCTTFKTMIPGDDTSLIPESISVDSSGFLRISGLNEDSDPEADTFVYATHGQSVGNFGGSLNGKYKMRTFE